MVVGLLYVVRYEQVDVEIVTEHVDEDDVVVKIWQLEVLLWT